MYLFKFCVHFIEKVKKAWRETETGDRDRQRNREREKERKRRETERYRESWNKLPNSNGVAVVFHYIHVQCKVCNTEYTVCAHIKLFGIVTFMMSSFKCIRFFKKSSHCCLHGSITNRLNVWVYIYMYIPLPTNNGTDSSPQGQYYTYAHTICPHHLPTDQLMECICTCTVYIIMCHYVSSLDIMHTVIIIIILILINYSLPSSYCSQSQILQILLGVVF